MADYKELLRRAIQALPENNGAARRAVYEKARAALVGQLRGINPPLPAKDITQHRLQLEDCIRQVEQEASEAGISLKQHDDTATRTPRVERPEPVHSQPQQPPPEPAKPAAVPDAVSEAKPRPGFTGFGRGRIQKIDPVPGPDNSGSIEAIIAEAERTTAQPVPVHAPPVADVSAVAELEPEIAEAPRLPEPANERQEGGVVQFAAVVRVDPTRGAPPANRSGSEPPRRGPSFEPRREGGGNAAIAQVSEAARQSPPRLDVDGRSQAALRQQADSLVLVGNVPAAMSAVREVEVEPHLVEAHDSQRAIENAIATLDREARGVAGPASDAPVALSPGLDVRQVPRPSKGVARAADETRDDGDLDVADAGRGGGRSALTIFLLVFVLLLAGAAGGGFWAWREGYVDLDTMFGRGQTNAQASVEPGALEPVPVAPATNVEADPAEVPSGPGNTAPIIETVQPQPELLSEDRLPATPEGAPAAEATAPELIAPTTDEPKTEERLTTADTGAVPADPTALNLADPSAIAGNQSLLLEAAENGASAVPFTGTVDWTKGVDETGQPTLIGKADIPARNLGVEVIIRRNADQTLPASHLMEVRFDVTETFIGGAISSLPGVLFKNEELVQGDPLAGASARVVGNSFLFALSASSQDEANNVALLARKWMDLAIVYATGKRAIITLEKDATAEALFAEVLTAWEAQASNDG